LFIRKSPNPTSINDLAARRVPTEQSAFDKVSGGKVSGGAARRLVREMPAISLLAASRLVAVGFISSSLSLREEALMSLPPAFEASRN
jgi:hypothetical protein